MIEFEFQEQAARLKKAYGQQANEEFLAVLWRKFGRHDKRIFAEAVDYMVEERAQLKISVISEAVNTRARRYSQPLDGKGEEIQCDTCNKAGMMFASSKQHSFKIFVRCFCEWGANADDALPQWKQAMAQDFNLVRLPPMKPDFSPLRNDPRLSELSDDKFFEHPKVRNFISSAMASSLDWWATQKKIAGEYWAEYFAEGLAR